MSDTDERIRERAYRIWLDEGRPDGRAETHWEMAAELVALEDEANQASMLKPNPLRPGEETIEGSGEPVEPLEVMDNLGEFPTLTDQGEEQTVPKRPRADPGRSVAKKAEAAGTVSAGAKPSAKKSAGSTTAAKKRAGAEKTASVAPARQGARQAAKPGTGQAPDPGDRKAGSRLAGRRPASG